MSNPTIQQNAIPTDPTLKDVLDIFKKEIFLSLNCHHIGTIQSFNTSNQTATATINYKKTFFQRNAQTGLYDPVLQDYPVLLDCPVILLGGHQASLTFPIAAGDECLVLFNDRDIDNWLQGGGSGAVATPRLHSFADGLIIVGIRSLAHVISHYDSSRVVLRNGDPSTSGAAVGVSTSQVKIWNNVTTLNTLLQSLVTAIKAITVNVVGVQGGSSTIVSSVPNNLATLSSIATQIGGLLE